jgi:transcriptional regulator with XRE-family HTH domain
VPLTVKALRSKDYSETPKTFGQRLKKRRRELGLLQREAAERMGVSAETVANWENGKTAPVPAHFGPVVAFLGYDPMPTSTTLAERVRAKRRVLGATHSQIARYLEWDPGTLSRYLNGTWLIPPARAASLEAFLSANVEALASALTLPRRR